jgi:alkylation response protein AidB-like acyl-CoA dehydrogenase
MDFDFSEPQRILLDSARNFFGKEAKDYARKIEKEGTQFSPEFWQKMAQLGWLGIVFPEEYGGTEGDFADLVLLLEEMGKALIPGPFISTIVSGLAILHFGSEEQKRKFLPPLIEGKFMMTPALLNPRPQTQDRQELESIRLQPERYEISGTRLLVPYAQVSHCLVYSCEAAGGKTFYLIETNLPGVSCSLLPTIAMDGQCQVSLEKVQIRQEDRLGQEGQGEVISAWIGKWGALAHSAFILGLLEKVLALTVEHAKQREQFGKPIGSFQAIQHQCADMVTEIDKIKFLTYRAAWKLSREMRADKEISMAKVRASDASRKVCLLGIKIHGGIGISEEHDLQLYFRKAKAAEIAFGDASFHREVVARELGL